MTESRPEDRSLINHIIIQSRTKQTKLISTSDCGENLSNTHFSFGKVKISSPLPRFQIKKLNFYKKTVLPSGRYCGCITPKEPNKKKSGLTNLRPNFGRFCTESLEKSPLLILSDSKYQRHIILFPRSYK